MQASLTAKQAATLKDFVLLQLRVLDRTSLRRYQTLLEQQLNLVRTQLQTLDANVRCSVGQLPPHSSDLLSQESALFPAGAGKPANRYASPSPSHAGQALASVNKNPSGGPAPTPARSSRPAVVLSTAATGAAQSRSVWVGNSFTATSGSRVLCFAASLIL